MSFKRMRRCFSVDLQTGDLGSVVGAVSRKSRRGQFEVPRKNRHMIEAPAPAVRTLTDAVLEKMIKGCPYFVVAHETHTLLGYARPFTDDIALTWIAEILVHPERRRQGVGTHIMNELLRLTNHTAIYTQALAGNVGLLCIVRYKSEAPGR